MSDHQNVLQKPVFAPVSQGNKLVDDIDLSDIFAEYFNEGGDDPLTTFSNPSICGDAAAAGQRIQQQQVQQISSILTPFGTPQTIDPGFTIGTRNTTLPRSQGIKTPYHAGLKQEPQIQSTSQVQQVPPPKKMKSEHLPTQYQQVVPAPTPSRIMQVPGINPLGVAVRTQTPGGINPLGVAARTQTPGINPLCVIERMHNPDINQVGGGGKMQASSIDPHGVTGGQSRRGLSGRLGISMVGGQLSIPQTNSAGIRPVVSQDAKLPFVCSSTPLPVGRGIRVGNIIPQATSSAPLNQSRSITGSSTNIGATITPTQNNYSSWMGLGGMGGGPGGMSETAIAERRQRNREHAKRSRVRKKFMLESLQHEVRDLQKENNNLRMIIQGKIPQHAQKIIDECCQKSPLFDDGEEEQPQPDDSKKKVQLVKSDFSLISSLTSGQQNFVLSDPRLLDNPIVYASEGFYQLTGYARDEVLGRNCRFLQGPGTDPKAIDVIRAAVANGTDATTCLLNYKADGTPFWNQFFVAALRDSDNCIVNYVGVQCAVDSNVGASALEDKVNSVLPLQNRGESPTQDNT